MDVGGWPNPSDRQDRQDGRQTRQTHTSAFETASADSFAATVALSAACCAANVALASFWRHEDAAIREHVGQLCKGADHIVLRSTFSCAPSSTILRLSLRCVARVPCGPLGTCTPRVVPVRVTS